jgi:hypothetical protein
VVRQLATFYVLKVAAKLIAGKTKTFVVLQKAMPQLSHKIV